VCVLIAAALLAAPPGCTEDNFFFNTTSLGGNNPLTNGTGAGRGLINMAFVNNTPYRAIFTFGVYDPLNPDFQPQFEQFSVGENANLLNAFSESDTATFTCARALSIAGRRFVEIIEEEDARLPNGDRPRPEAMRPLPDPRSGEEQNEPGIAFVRETDPATAIAASAVGFDTPQGAQFQCESLLIYTFELDPDDPVNVLVDLTVVLP
jgi:hypothetical protein